MRIISPLLLLSTLAIATSADAVPSLTVSVDGVRAGAPIAESYVRCKPSTDGKSTDGENLRPAIRWSGAPKGTSSFAVFVMDPDVPADFSDAGKDGKTIAANAKRQDFFHYGVINIPANSTQLNSGHPENAPVGKELANDMGLNRYVPTPAAFGGPCPPWNDERVHHYHFIVLALDKDAAADQSGTSATDCSNPSCMADTAKNTFHRLIESKHVLAKGTVVGTYTLNPSLRK